MAILGVHTIGGGGGSGVDTSVMKILGDALWGDAKTEMDLALKRQEYDREDWIRRNYDANIAQSEAAARASTANAANQEYQTKARQDAAGPIADQQVGLLEAPAPVEIAPATTRYDLPPDAPAIVADDPYSIYAAGQSAAPPLPGGNQLPMVSGIDVAPVDLDYNTPFGIQAAGALTSPLLPRGSPDLPTASPALPDVNMPVPVEVPAEMGVRPEDQAAYDRDVAAVRAKVNAMLAMGQSASDIAKGVGISEGAVRMLSEDPEQQELGKSLYGDTRPAATAGPGASPYLKQELEMRKQLEGLDAYKKLSAVVPVYLSMAKSAGGPLDQAAVLDLVYGLATAEDPGSVVREQDSIQVRRIGGLSGEMQDIVGYITGGKPITPEIVARIMRTAHNRVGSYNAAYEHQAKDYRSIAERSGYDVRNAIPTFPELAEFKPPLPPGVTEEQVQAYAQQHNLPVEQARQILLDRAAAAAAAAAAPAGAQ